MVVWWETDKLWAVGWFSSDFPTIWKIAAQKKRSRKIFDILWFFHNYRKFKELAWFQRYAAMWCAEASWQGQEEGLKQVVSSAWVAVRMNQSIDSVLGSLSGLYLNIQCHHAKTNRAGDTTNGAYSSWCEAAGARREKCDCEKVQVIIFFTFPGNSIGKSEIITKRLLPLYELWCRNFHFSQQSSYHIEIQLQ